MAAKGKRCGFVDEFKGVLVIGMVLYHLVFTLLTTAEFTVITASFEKWLWGVFNHPVISIARDIGAGCFIFIAGMMCKYSHSNFKRGFACFAMAMIISVVTFFLVPEYFIKFGILHLMGVSIILYALFEKGLNKIPTILGIIIFASLFISTLHITQGWFKIDGLFAFRVPSSLYSTSYLFPLGFPNAQFTSGDYFPILPWTMLFLCGSYFGNYLRAGKLPSFVYNTHSKFLSATGRYCFWIYVLHQTVIYSFVLLLNSVLK